MSRFLLYKYKPKKTHQTPSATPKRLGRTSNMGYMSLLTPNTSENKNHQTSPAALKRIESTI